MSRATWILLASSLAWSGCGDDDAAPGSPDAAIPGPSSGTGGAGGMAAVGGELPTSGMGGSAGAGSAGTGGRSVCNAPMCGCFVCSSPLSVVRPTVSCLDCGLGCVCEDMGGSHVPWDPPFEEIGEVGWRDSTEPLCAGMDHPSSLDVYSDARGVFVMASGLGFKPLAPAVDEDGGLPDVSADAADAGLLDTDSFAARTTIWLNDGTGWLVYAERANQAGDFALHGAENSPLFISERPLAPTVPQDRPVEGPGAISCSIGTVRPGAVECLSLDPVQSLFVAGVDLAYAVMGETRLLTYDADLWRGHTSLLPYPAAAVWGDSTNVLAAGRSGTMLWLEQDAWRLEDPGTLEHITSVWGPARNDIWAGTARGTVLHYDGVSWTTVGKLGDETCDALIPITGIWGSGNTVYFHGTSALGRWNGSELELLTNWSCTPNENTLVRITGVWGTSPDEVFISIIDPIRFRVGLCGMAFVVHFDGTSFHRM